MKGNQTILCAHMEGPLHRPQCDPVDLLKNFPAGRIIAAREIAGVMARAFPKMLTH
jgi:hypothetical protein